MKTPRKSARIWAPFRGFLLCGALLTRGAGRGIVSKRFSFALLVLIPALVCAVTAKADDAEKARLDRQYQLAVADFDAQRYPQAAARLEPLLPWAEKSFEVHELMGLIYASLSQDAKAEEQLKIAVQLKPDSAAARTNFGASLLHSGKAALAGEQFRKALALDPQSYDANHNLGEFYIQTGKIADALPLLERAQQVSGGSYDNGYDLAMADFLLGRSDDARRAVDAALKVHDTGELHNLLGQINEKDGKYVAAANEYETAAHMDPSEENLFAWGSEMLLHMTYDHAITVFQEGVRRHPDSPRLQIGLGLALYSRGKYDDAVKALLKGADLSPTDARCYRFLSKAYESSPNQANAVVERFRRYRDLQPENGLAQYYYAMSLWKGKRTQDEGLDLGLIEQLLRKAIALDDTIPEAHVQLGNLLADQHQYEKSIPEFARALELNPNLPDAHYRLGTDYVHTGHKDLAQKEFDVYQKQRAEHLAKIDKERAEVQQFVTAAKAESSTRP